MNSIDLYKAELSEFAAIIQRRAKSMSSDVPSEELENEIALISVDLDQMKLKTFVAFAELKTGSNARAGI